jgi:hypothetical protein
VAANQYLDLEISMNEHDKQNLDFLVTISASETGWHTWCNQASFADIEYALELLTCYRWHLEAEFSLLDQLDTITDVSDAERLLAAF